jgi:hypothetical protein
MTDQSTSLTAIIARPSSLPQNEWILDNISANMALMTTSSALLFQGRLDLIKFEAALNLLVTHCPWLASALSVRETENDQTVTSVIPRKDGDPSPDSPGLGYVRCEVSFRQEVVYSSATVPLTELMPMDVHIKMLRVDLAMLSLDELPIAAFKVTQFQDHFAIGYRLNHCFYDQASIVDMFVFLSHLYSGGDLENDLRPLPQLTPRATLIADRAPFASQEEFQVAAPAGYVTAPLTELAFGFPIKVEIQFNAEKVNALRDALQGAEAAQNASLSTNDLLHAVLMKALCRCHLQRTAANDALPTEEKESATMKEIQIFYARNMRHPLSLPAHITGDYARLEAFTCTAAQAAKELSIVELAQRNRALLCKSNDEVFEQYMKECQWFRDFAQMTGSKHRPFSTFLTDKQAGVVTNWSSFPYEQIRFGSDSFGAEELLIDDAPVMTATGCFVRVTFRHHQDKETEKRVRELVVVVNTLDQDFADSLKTIAEENDGLFSCL